MKEYTHSSLGEVAKLSEHCNILIEQTLASRAISRAAISVLELLRDRAIAKNQGGPEKPVTLSDALTELRGIMIDAEDLKRAAHFRPPGMPNYHEELLQFIEAFWQ